MNVNKKERGNVVAGFLILVAFALIVLLALTMLDGTGWDGLSKLWFSNPNF